MTATEANAATPAAGGDAAATTPLLAVRDLQMYFPVKSSGIIRRTVGHVQAVDGVSFQVEAGGSLRLVGESGCGKSTTGRLVAHSTSRPPGLWSSRVETSRSCARGN